MHSTGRLRPIVVALLALTGTLALGATAIADAQPTASLEAPTQITFSSAHFNGEVDPQTGPSSTVWHFEFTPAGEESWSSFGGGEIPAETGGSPTGPVSVEETLGGLQPGTEYAVRLVAENEGGANQVVSEVKTFETVAVAKPEAKEVAVSAVDATSAQFEGVVNSGGNGAGEEAGTYRFECSPECPGLEADLPIPGSGSDEEVSDDTTGLQPNTTYTVMLIARNAQTDAEGEAVVDQAEFETPAVAPTVAVGPQGTFKATGATLIATVNPRHDALNDCHFEYGLTEGYGQSAPCSPDPGAANEAVVVSAQISGLAPSTAYHYRLFAENSAGSAATDDRTFTTLSLASNLTCANQDLRVEQGATALPDCRAWEMVSPPDKNGGDVVGDTQGTRASTDGDAVSFASFGAFGDVVGTGINTNYISERTAAPGTQGWSTHAITPPQQPVTGGTFTDARPLFKGDFSDDLSKGIFRAFSPLTDAPNVANQQNLYLLDGLRAPGPALPELLSNSVAPLPPPVLGTEQLSLVGTSKDFEHVLFETKANLTQDAIGAGLDPKLPRLYEWVNGNLRLAGILPDSECGAPPCVAPSSAAGLGHRTPNPHTFQHEISDDGSRIFFTSPVGDSAGPTGSSQLYMRINGATTVRINASEKAVPEPTPGQAEFETATPDGSTVIFSSHEQLTNTPGGGIYAYDTSLPDADPHNLTLISGLGNPAGGTVGLSSDASRIYFVTSEVTPEVPPSAHGNNLFLWESGVLRYIGSFSGDEAGQNAEGNAVTRNYVTGKLLSRVSPNGRYLVFRAADGAGFTGADHGSSCLDFEDSKPSCNEVYFYDAEANGGSGQLSCASCPPDGSPARAAASFSERTGVSTISPDAHLNHPLSVDGRRVFFTSGEPLVPADKNGLIADAYEYDTVTGQLHLLSSGRDSSGSYFLEASPSGDDAFFITREQLAGWDTDRSFDLYDARVGGGFPEPPTPPAPCSGADCRAPSAAAPSEAGAGSATSAGSGNRKDRHMKHRKRHKKKHRGKHQAKQTTRSHG